MYILILLFLLFATNSSGVVYAEEKIKLTSANIKNPKVNVEDNRAKILSKFLSQYQSPLAEYSTSFVKSADENKIDWKLLVAISGVESTFGKELPVGSYNAWGWGIYGNNAIYFKSYNEAIGTISKALKEQYIDSWGAKDVYQIGRLYAASPTWSQRVCYFMNQIDKFAFDNPQACLSLSM